MTTSGAHTDEPNGVTKPNGEGVRAAALAALSGVVSEASEARTHEAPRKKPDEVAKAKPSKSAVSYLVDSGALSAPSGAPVSLSGSSSGVLAPVHEARARSIIASLASLDEQARRRAVLLAIHPTTRAGTRDALSRALASLGARLLGAVYFVESVEGDHVHAHGLALFADDASAALFGSSFTSAADGEPQRSWKPREVTGWAAFARTGHVSAAWAERGLDDDLAALLRYASKSGGECYAFGLFAGVATVTPTARVCSCGCRRSLDGRRGDATCFNGACRRRLWRASHAEPSKPKRGTAALEPSSRPKRGESKPAADTEPSKPKRGESTPPKPSDTVPAYVLDVMARGTSESTTFADATKLLRGGSRAWKARDGEVRCQVDLGEALARAGFVTKTSDGRFALASTSPAIAPKALPAFLRSCRDALAAQHHRRRFGREAARRTLTHAQLVDVNDADDRQQVRDVLAKLVQLGALERIAKRGKRTRFRLAKTKTTTNTTKRKP